MKKRYFEFRWKSLKDGTWKKTRDIAGENKFQIEEFAARIGIKEYKIKEIT